MAIATLNHVELIPPESLNYQGMLPKVEMSREQFEKTVMTSLGKLSPTAWSLDTYNFTYER